MPAQRVKILVVGGGSRIAGALGARLGPTASFVSRRQSRRPAGLEIEDYGSIPASAFDGVRCVINCVGISEGSRDQLMRVNAGVARDIALAAKGAGVPNMIHISSFSVYGPARLIERRTPPAPVSDYGRSKLTGDAAVLELADTHFGVTLLRLPLIYSEESLGKLGQLLRLWREARILPVPSNDVSRAMISVDMSAAVLTRLAAEPRSGVVFAADPRPFTYADAMRARPELLYRLPLPRLVTDFFERVVPGIASKVFADSHLADADNLAVEYGLASQLYRDIAAAELH